MNWHERFLELAKLVSTWSRDPSTRVGAVIVDGRNRVVSVGFNGFPRGVADDDRLYDRDTKYEMIVHAEVNALMFAEKDLTGCRLYSYPFMPCSRCAAVVIQAGITEVYAPYFDNARWNESFNLSARLLREASVGLYLIGEPE